ncbi:MAG: Toxin RelE3 [Candidatus Argoarchaeum ethanivorans]|uniref:Toxin RelE3 n=1 Tax=Candidatus Argoarchaeum ethanivorans TaxID=2608793 RepID=A0A811T6W3_9EURY|nr:MAG: Toxin RelE3 [Candidatus Argoarchaeum ethanivorans]CAD6491051.1 MAG: Toxin RelE3 [Candidatus Argoarchaeum ethanivorans]CAD6491608.1 MAG: Toxin RelE3 [Candidatus Argoarchaeum ethanivorans]
MITCSYKKTFLKDLVNLPSVYRERIEKLVFEEIPEFDNIFGTLDIKKMRGYRDYYRIRVGKYRIGCKVESENRIIFYRVKSRDDIYKVFP